MRASIQRRMYMRLANIQRSSIFARCLSVNTGSIVVLIGSASKSGASLQSSMKRRASVTTRAYCLESANLTGRTITLWGCTLLCSITIPSCCIASAFMKSPCSAGVIILFVAVLLQSNDQVLKNMYQRLLLDNHVCSKISYENLTGTCDIKKAKRKTNCEGSSFTLSLQ